MQSAAAALPGLLTALKEAARFSLQETAEAGKSITFKRAAGALLREHIRVAKVLKGVYPGKAIRLPSAP
jgi:hypothetical protein